MFTIPAAPPLVAGANTFSPPGEAGSTIGAGQLRHMEYMTQLRKTFQRAKPDCMFLLPPTGGIIYKFIAAKRQSTTLSGQRPLSNFRTLRPFGAEPRQPSSLNPAVPRVLYHSSSPQGSSEILSRRMYTFSVSYSICSDQRVTARMRSWVRAHSRRMKVTLSRL